MKYAPAILIAVIFCCFGCGLDTLKGSGNKVTQNRDVASFNAVVIDAPLHAVINMQPGAQPALQLSGYENLLKHLKTSVENNTLRIYSDLEDGWEIDDNGLTAQITLPSLTALTLDATNSVQVHGAVSGNQLKVKLSGTADIAMDNVTVDSIISILSGTGDMKIKDGVVKYAEYKINGTGNIKASSLKASEATATINGTGSMLINASQKLAAHINGTGSITYTGDPVLSQDVSGTGNIAKAD